MSTKTFSMFVDNKDYYFVKIGRFYIGIENEPQTNYAVICQKVLKYPITTLTTASARIDKGKGI